MACNLQKLVICVSRGSAVDLPIRIESRRLRWVPITDIAQQAPARITAPGHGFSDQWRLAVVSALGMTEINAPREVPRDSDLKPRDVIDADTVEFNEINASRFGEYTGGGYLVGYEPRDMSDITAARMQVNDEDGNLLAYFDSAGDRDGTLEVDPSNHGLRLKLTEEQALALVFPGGAFDIELVVSGFGPVKACAPTSEFIVLPEQTTNHP